MIKTLKTIAAELKRANDLKERDIKNKETWMWYSRPSANRSDMVYSNFGDRHSTTSVR
jgi:hypothetical protein